MTVLLPGARDRGDLASVGVYGIRVSGSDFSATRRVAIVRQGAGKLEVRDRRE